MIGSAEPTTVMMKTVSERELVVAALMMVTTSCGILSKNTSVKIDVSLKTECSGEVCRPENAYSKKILAVGKTINFDET